MKRSKEKETGGKKVDLSSAANVDHTKENHTDSAAPAAEAERQSSSDPALPSAHPPLPQPAVPYQNWEKFRIKNDCD